jgi:hypothetical protein
VRTVIFQVGLARSNAVGDQGEPSLMTQDLLSGIGSAATEGDTVDVRYIAFALTTGRLGEVCLNIQKVLHSYINLRIYLEICPETVDERFLPVSLGSQFWSCFAVPFCCNHPP